MNNKFLLISLTTLLLTSCGKIDSMFEMPNKMDTMINKMGGMNEKMGGMSETMNQMNKTMGQMNAMADKMQSMDSKMNTMNDMSVKMDGLGEKTSELARKETLKTAVAELQNTDNYQKLSPIPTDLLPWGRKAAENFLVNEELIPYIYIKLKDINEVKYEDNSMGKPSNPENPEAVEFEMNKVGLFYSLMSVCGFLPESKVDQILQRIENSEEYTNTSLNILALRYFFIENVLMAEKYKATNLTDLGTIEAAISYNKSLERIIKLPFVDLIKTKTTVFSILTDYNEAMSISVDPLAAKNNWASILEGMTKYYKEFKTSDDVKKSAEKKKRYDSALATVNAAIKSYSN